MTIDKAIRRLTGYLKYRKPESDDYFHESVQLGIEALSIIKEEREGKEGPWYKLLPGETEE